MRIVVPFVASGALLLTEVRGMCRIQSHRDKYVSCTLYRAWTPQDPGSIDASIIGTDKANPSWAYQGTSLEAPTEATLNSLAARV